jgi:F-type H+-transporting ATPase subunit gamma
MTQRPVLQQLLPVEPARIERSGEIEYIYEPDSRTVLAQLLPRFVEMEVYHAILEAIASEQSARMVAMRNATENANDLIQDLTLMYNKARQEIITKELLDITGGAEAQA